MVSGIRLDDSSAVPLYRQLYEQISSMVKSGVICHGDRLPPTRELAGQLGLNRTTVSAAYELLEADGLVQGHVGRGSFVHYRQQSEPPERRQIISFASSRPAADQFPLGDFQACCREVTSGADALSILQLGAPAGYAPLRNYLLDQARSEGCARADDDVVITNGCQQALDVIARLFAPPGSPVAVEDPVYHGVKHVFTRGGARLIGVPVGQRGIDVERLSRLIAAEQPRLLVVTPNFQNPTGGSLPLQERLAILRVTREFRVTLVENDLYGELRYQGERLPTLKELDDTGSTILIRSFSKIAFPGLRVGWVVAPTRIAADIAEARQWCDLHTDQLSQAILWRFATSGRLAAHLQRVRETGRERLEAALSACGRHLPSGSTFTRPEGGMNTWLRLPGALDAADLVPRAHLEGADYLPGRHFAVSHYDPSTLRLSFVGLKPEQIEAGVAILGRVFRSELERSSRGGRLEALPALV